MGRDDKVFLLWHKGQFREVAEHERERLTRAGRQRVEVRERGGREVSVLLPPGGRGVLDRAEDGAVKLAVLSWLGREVGSMPVAGDMIPADAWRTAETRRERLAVRLGLESAVRERTRRKRNRAQEHGRDLDMGRERL